MADLARSRGIKIDAEKLSELLDLPVVFTVGNKNKGIDTLLKNAIKLAELNYQIPQKRKVKYNKDIENSISKLQSLIEKTAKEKLPYNFRWTAIHLLEDDKIVKERVLQKGGNSGQDILQQTQELRKYLMDRLMTIRK